jgi:hypothetical protein
MLAYGNATMSEVGVIANYEGGVLILRDEDISYFWRRDLM